MKNFKILFLFLFITTFSVAQNAKRTFESIENKNTYFQINVNDGFYQISRYSSKIIETTFIPINQKELIESHAVILNSNINYSIFKEEQKKQLF